ncbi:MAG: hypothetical protein ONB16_02995 [candidate division KSB1 bacterium]|nr:hypothetical protein [candidate division KSB1 bacterium]MDZ7319720.1 hypothetical protein [candidate division KSB1 bacterium]
MNKFHHALGRAKAEIIAPWTALEPLLQSMIGTYTSLRSSSMSGMTQFARQQQLSDLYHAAW